MVKLSYPLYRHNSVHDSFQFDRRQKRLREKDENVKVEFNDEKEEEEEKEAKKLESHKGK